MREIDRHRRNWQDSNALRNKLRRIAVKEASYRSGHAVPAVTVGAVREKPEGKASPGAVHSVHRDGADGIVDFQFSFNEKRPFHHQHAGDQADDAGADGVDKGAGRGDRHQPGKHSVAHHAGIRFLEPHDPHPEGCSQRPRGRGQHGVGGDHADSQIRSGQGRTGVETEPAEGQDERSDDGHGDVVAGNRVWAAVLVDISQSGARSSMRQPGQMTPPVM